MLKTAQWWRILRPIVAVAIIGGVGVHFYRLLSRPEIYAAPLIWRWPQLVTCAFLYAAGIACWGLFWTRLMQRQTQVPSSPLLRAYLASLVGKYVPGKAVVIVLRAAFVHPRGVPVVVTAVMTVYETLTIMAFGALLAALVAAFADVGQPGAMWRAIAMLAIAGVPVLPGVFDRLAGRMTRRFLPEGHAPPPPLRLTTLAEGCALGGAGWLLLGLSVAQLLAAVLPTPPALTAALVARLVGYNALAYVAGFLVLPAPGGLGVREVILQQLLVSLPLNTMIDDAHAAAAVLLLRGVWAGVEVSLAVITYGYEWVSKGMR